MTMSAPAPRFAIIIPARYASTRFPGKPLAPLRGASGGAKPLIQRSWNCARTVTDASNIWIATDDARIRDVVKGFGGQVVMTSPDCRNGTERCADAAAQLGDIGDIIVNLQGDAPLTPAFVVTGLVDALAADPLAVMATPAIGCSPTLYRHLVTDQAAGRVGGTTMVFNAAGHALYFSKRVIPHVPDSLADEAHKSVFLHLGVYAYRREGLAAYTAREPSRLEALEGLEQLRFLESDRPVRVVPFAPIAWDCIELNNVEDIPAIEAVLAAREIL
jgi:3-deoxy-manno-octulosonate cytidylyltransferase (CMP-KDO synthetase)